MNTAIPGELKNGFRYYSQFDISANVCGVGIKCGSMHDPPKKRGQAHLMEHMRCRSSPKYVGEQVDLLMEKYMGGPGDDTDINVRIDRASTFFGNNSLLYRRHLVICWDMWVELVLNGVLDVNGLDVEKAAIHQEYFLYGKDVMYNLVDDLIHQVMYDKNPARNRVDCEPGELATITLEQMRQFYNSMYASSQNMFAVILGPQHKEVKRMVERSFDWLPNKGRLVLDIDMSDKFPQLQRIKSLEISRRDIGQYHLAIGFPTRPYLESCKNGDAEALDVLARILAFRLRMKLREGNRNFDQGVYQVLTYTPRTFAHGMIYIWFATKDLEFAKTGEEIFLKECADLRQNLVREEELDAMASNILYNYLDAHIKTPGTLSELIIDAVCNGDEDLTYLNSFRERLSKIRQNRGRIRKAANDYFSLPNYARVMISPA